jgi:DNA-binding response OmpR family regulator
LVARDIARRERVTKLTADVEVALWRAPARNFVMRVLIADDSETQRAQLSGLIRRGGHEVLDVGDGAEALAALLDPNGPHLALLDWEMPGLNGTDVCRRVREAPLSIRPHLVLLTARSEKQDVLEGLKAGADDYLSKPIVPAELIARLKVAQRNVEVQLELELRTRALEQALSRLEAVNVVASRIALEAIEASAPVELLLERALGDVTRSLTVVSGPEPIRALGSLVLPSEGRWLDVVLEVRGTVDRGVANGAPAHELVADLLTMTLQRVHAALTASGRSSLVPFPGRLVRGSVPEAQRRAVGPWTLLAVPQALQAASTPYDALAPNVVLLSGLRPPSMLAVEVLRAGTLLKPAHLERTKAFFRGADAKSAVDVATPSELSLKAQG